MIKTFLSTLVCSLVLLTSGCTDILEDQRTYRLNTFSEEVINNPNLNYFVYMDGTNIAYDADRYDELIKQLKKNTKLKITGQSFNGNGMLCIFLQRN